MFTWRLFVYLSILSCSVYSDTVKRNVVCSELTQLVLSDILGPAFNSRYMSIDQPVDDNFRVDDKLKRKVGVFPPFYVDDGYARVLTDEPAWSVNHIEVSISAGSDRKRRAAVKNARQWECESKISWIDLGLDYFPRYLRSVECKSKTCWYGHYKCKPRSFTVKILRRKRGRCTVSRPGGKVGTEGLPSDLRELWVWEERAVNFCCDCAL